MDSDCGTLTFREREEGERVMERKEKEETWPGEDMNMKRI